MHLTFKWKGFGHEVIHQRQRKTIDGDPGIDGLSSISTLSGDQWALIVKYFRLRYLDAFSVPLSFGNDHCETEVFYTVWRVPTGFRHLGPSTDQWSFRSAANLDVRADDPLIQVQAEATRYRSGRRSFKFMGMLGLFTPTVPDAVAEPRSV